MKTSVQLLINKINLSCGFLSIQAIESVSIYVKTLVYNVLHTNLGHAAKLTNGINITYATISAYPTINSGHTSFNL